MPPTPIKPDEEYRFINFVIAPVRFYRPRMILKHSFDWFAPSRMKPYLVLTLIIW